MKCNNAILRFYVVHYYNLHISGWTEAVGWPQAADTRRRLTDSTAATRTEAVADAAAVSWPGAAAWRRRGEPDPPNQTH